MKVTKKEKDELNILAVVEAGEFYTPSKEELSKMMGYLSRKAHNSMTKKQRVDRAKKAVSAREAKKLSTFE